MCYKVTGITPVFGYTSPLKKSVSQETVLRLYDTPEINYSAMTNNMQEGTAQLLL